MRLKLKKLVVRSFDLDHLDVSWEVEDFEVRNTVITAYDFYVLRSESPEGPWDTLAGPFVDQYSFRDASPNLLHKWRRLFYRIKVIERATSEEWISSAASLVSEPDLIALEVQRQEDVLLRQFTGRRCWLFPVRTFGAKCDCYDKVMGRRMRSSCYQCFDTGFMGGYLRPIECYIQFDPNPDHPIPTSAHGERQDKNTSARLIAYPPVKPKDIIVEPENKRWRVATVARTERLRAVVHQELSLHAIPKGDMEYKLPLDLPNLADQRFQEERNYTNPQHIDDQGVPNDDLLAPYGYKPRGTVG